MRIRSPSLAELHALVAVSQTGSFSLAAQRLRITQGAVSRAVLRLEARLGQPLLERTPSGVRPTAIGRSYCKRIAPALAVLEEAIPVTAAPSGVLRLSVLPTLGQRWLVPRLPTLRAAHPWLRIALRPYRQEDDLLRDDVDCWIRTRTSATSRWPRHVQATYILGKEVVAVCHPSVARQIRQPADVLRFPLLQHANYPGNWAAWLQAQGLEGAAPLGDAFDLGAGLIEAVAANMGIAVLQPCLIEREVAEGRIAVPLDAVASTGRGYYLCVPRASADTLAVSTLRSWLVEQAATDKDA
ncbi:MAG: LysR family transcriptional regulator [Comamonadaceae bacterium]|nr:MAG: LysR family transcriptional regulator [Comamonadaceae bacterium]